MRQVLMIEINGDTPAAAAERLATALPDVQVWGGVDPCEAALIVLDAERAAA